MRRAAANRTSKEAVHLTEFIQGIQDYWQQLFRNVFQPSTIITDLLDILIVAFVVYELILLVRQTRAAQLAKGIIILLLFNWVANTVGLRTVAYALNNLMQASLILLIVVFQPELRRALEQMGRTNIFAVQLFKNQAVSYDLREKWRNAVVAICDAAERLSDSRTGALIVIERKTNLGEIIKTGTAMNGDINPEVLGTIFYEGTPLHDGAVVVRDGKIKAAGCFLPLSNNLEIGKDMGTRHRAALGMSENSDAVVVVVSEETGIISMAKNGVLIRRLDRQNLFNLLQEELVPPEEKEPKKALFWRGKHEKKKD